MVTIGKKLLGFLLLLLVLLAAVPSGCVSDNDGPRHARSDRDVTIGGRKGVVVERSGNGTAVEVGGDHGVVVGNPRD